MSMEDRILRQQEIACGETCADYCERLDELSDERDKLEEERDEARKQRDELDAQLESVIRAIMQTQQTCVLGSVAKREFEKVLKLAGGV